MRQAARRLLPLRVQCSRGLLRVCLIGWTSRSTRPMLSLRLGNLGGDHKLELLAGEASLLSFHLDLDDGMMLQLGLGAFHLDVDSIVLPVVGRKRDSVSLCCALDLDCTLRRDWRRAMLGGPPGTLAAGGS